MSGVNKVLVWAATVACQRGRKLADCQCPPCQARLLAIGANDPVQIQETLRAQAQRYRVALAWIAEIDNWLPTEPGKAVAKAREALATGPEGREG
jgi:hypothetical protein